MEILYYNILSLLVVLFYISFSDGVYFRNDYSYNKDADGWFKLHVVPANWFEARLRCHHEGAVLASPIDDKLVTAMKLMTANVASCGVFTGVHATFSRGDYTSIEGVPLYKMPIRWAPHEPDNYENNENCLLFLQNGTMADVDCSDVFPYLCYKKKTRRMYINGCGTIDNEYTLDSRTGSCYKFHREVKTWSRAYMACAGEGGYLAIINSEIEAQVLRELFAKNPPDVIPGKNSKDVAHIGFHDWGEHGMWLTIHGETLRQAGYEKWASSQWNNLTTGHYCGCIFRSALLNDIWCENRYVFICEMEPRSLVGEDYL